MTDHRHEFPQHPQLLYLNHAAVSPWPARTARAVAEFAEQNLLQGAADYPQWLQVEQRLRQQLAQLINIDSPNDIALVKNTSEGLSMIAMGLDWRDGDEVVISDEEFPSNRIPWEALAARGVFTRVVALGGADPEAELIAALGPRTRLLSISSVQFASGRRLDLERLGDACRRHGVLFCVDAIQSLGAQPFDAQACGADFVVADGHKWMLGPEGLGLFYSRPAARDQLALTQYGWHMVEDAGNYDRTDWQPAASARRFECGSPNMLGIHALSASLSLLLEVGLEHVAMHIESHVQALQDGLAGHGQLCSPSDPARRAGILVWRPDGDLLAAHQRVTAAGLICARRGGGLRLSPHFYHDPSVIDRVLRILLA
ncbi:aminotransferase class V-fold PLP-dependent enzyme [Isoalcanivorax beigongshangi]|uniref:Aminotransferase class V-fold PLP-dependent enzyme n=1 Tax=Isoalcanivorax beigongshangi TaxID=3238810 RepID=A0ABV4AGA5_9GAMM